MKSPLTAAVFGLIATTVVAGNAFGWASRPNDRHFYRHHHQQQEVSTVAVREPVGVPEPSTLGLMGIGLLGVGLIARRRK